MSLIHQIGLTLIHRAGPVTVKKLLAAFGSPEAVFAASKEQLLQKGGINSHMAEEILHSNVLSLAAAQLDYLRQHDIQVLFYTDEKYPRRLKYCYDAPVLLYYKGTADLNHPRIVSIVGTRMATPYGLMLCQQLAETLRQYDVLVISGLAYGIDVAAHQHCLSYDIPTVGVLGHGLDMLYPAAHRQTANAMLKNGGLLTEFPLKARPEKGNFPKRNRIIAGLSDVTVVVEAALKGGALITADIANSYDRDVFAFPGRTVNQYSEGCNFLIKTNRAGLISHARDLMYYMGWDTVLSVDAVRQTRIWPELSVPEMAIVNLLKNAEMRIDELCLKAGIQHSKLTVHLLNLEIKGVIIVRPGNIYQLIQ